MTTPATVRNRHPIRALLWGLLVGIGVAIYLTLVFPVIRLESVTSAAIQMGVVAVAVAVVLMLLTMFVIPPKKPKGPPPARRASPRPAAPAPEPDASEGDQPSEVKDEGGDTPDNAE